MSKFVKILLLVTFYSALAGLACSALAQTFFPLSPGVIEPMQNQTNDVVNQAYNPNTGPVSLLEIVAGVIRVFLGILGTIFVVLMILAGYSYMNARGDKTKVDKSLSTIRTAIIGLVIIASAYAITYWVFARLPDSR